MSQPIFSSFRLVGGTALSLQVGHRMSVDIDLFTDAEYGSFDFKLIEEYLKRKYAYFSTSGVAVIGMGTSYFVGNSSENSLSEAILANVIRPPLSLKKETSCIILFPAADDLGSGQTNPIIKTCNLSFIFQK